MRLEFHPEGLEEFEATTRYYASCRPGLELRFIEAVQSALKQIEDGPDRWRMFESDVRRFLVHVFPYAVLYSIEADFVLILAVMHLRREPGYWRHRH